MKSFGPRVPISASERVGRRTVTGMESVNAISEVAAQMEMSGRRYESGISRVVKTLDSDALFGKWSGIESAARLWSPPPLNSGFEAAVRSLVGRQTAVEAAVRAVSAPDFGRLVGKDLRADAAIRSFGSTSVLGSVGMASVSAAVAGYESQMSEMAARLSEAAGVTRSGQLRGWLDGVGQPSAVMRALERQRLSVLGGSQLGWVQTVQALVEAPLFRSVTDAGVSAMLARQAAQVAGAGLRGTGVLDGFTTRELWLPGQGAGVVDESVGGWVLPGAAGTPEFPLLKAAGFRVLADRAVLALPYVTLGTLYVVLSEVAPEVLELLAANLDEFAVFIFLFGFARWVSQQLAQRQEDE